MARMKFLLDAERCIECNACVTACKNEHEVPWGINRRRVVTINDGKPGERSISMACMHCTDAPCAAVCPVSCFYTTADAVVLHDKDLCIGCGYCFYACPFGAPQYPRVGNFGSRGKMDKCTYCAGGPEAETLEAVGTFSPAPLGITPQTVEVRAFAEDYLPGRDRIYSAPAVVLVMGSADHALWINDQIARWKQQTAEVRDREMELLARNEELQELSADELDAPENRKAIREQAAAEKNNGRRLERLADSGAELVGQALRNPEFDAATLESLAQNVQDLKAMAETRMPGIGEQGGCWRYLNDAAGVHHANPVGELRE